MLDRREKNTAIVGMEWKAIADTVEHGSSCISRCSGMAFKKEAG